MPTFRQIRSALSGKRGLHPYCGIVLVYLTLLLLSHLAKMKLRPSIVELEDTEREPVMALARYPAYDPSISDEEESILTRSFREADFDSNKLLSSAELAMAISRQTKQHIMHAMRNNFKVFFSLDKRKKNGQVDWDEYYPHYLVNSLGLDEVTIRKLQESPATVSRDVKESVSRLRAAWSEAARSNPEAVNIDEFLSLEHPESSHTLLMQQVEEMLSSHDADGDGKITRTEYLRNQFRDLDDSEKKVKGYEFDHALDGDKNGLAERKELMVFLDPKHKHWAREEAWQLVGLADKDGDKSLDLQEVLSHPDLFLTSKLISPAISFHGEF